MERITRTIATLRIWVARAMAPELGVHGASYYWPESDELRSIKECAR